MIGPNRVDWDNLKTLLQLTISFLLFTETCCVTMAALVSVRENLLESGTSQVNFMETLEPTIIEKPYFVRDGPTTVTVAIGQTATLNCRVRHPGDRTISWMRQRDLHILTSNIHTYTSDGRFSVVHPEQSDDWDLRIEYVQKRDAGVYECQVNTEPKINMAVKLQVEEVSALAGTYSGPMQSTYQREAQATISGSQDVYVKKGSTIALTCTVNMIASSIQWYHGTTAVDFDSQRGGISLETEKTGIGVTSKLLITKAALSDSGNYMCVPSNASSASVAVHVIIGENPAAMQSAANRISQYIILFVINFSIFLFKSR